MAHELGHLRCRGVYDTEAPQVLKRRARGGVYWFQGGWHARATGAWGPGAAVSAGVDCSFILSGPVGGVACAA